MPSRARFIAGAQEVAPVELIPLVVDAPDGPHQAPVERRPDLELRLAPRPPRLEVERGPAESLALHVEAEEQVIDAVEPWWDVIGIYDALADLVLRSGIDARADALALRQQAKQLREQAKREIEAALLGKDLLFT